MREEELSEADLEKAENRIAEVERRQVELKNWLDDARAEYVTKRKYQDPVRYSQATNEIRSLGQEHQELLRRTGAIRKILASRRHGKPNPTGTTSQDRRERRSLRMEAVFIDLAEKMLPAEIFAGIIAAARAIVAVRESNEEPPLALPAPVAPVAESAKTKIRWYDQPVLQNRGPAVPTLAPTVKPPQPLKARLSEFVPTGTNNRMMKFDPARLFKEFGREQVLGCWNMLPPHKQPETAREFRDLLLKANIHEPFEQKA